MTPRDARRSTPTVRVALMAATMTALSGPAAMIGCGSGAPAPGSMEPAAAAAGAQPAPDGQAAAPDEYVREILEWRAARDKRLRAEGGWLTVVGLHWLQPGESRVGSAPDMEVPLPDGPPLVGVLRLTDGRVELQPEDGAGLLVNGQAAAPGTLRADTDEGGPDVLAAGRLTLYLIRRGGQVGVRVKDPETRARREFTGVESFPVDPAWRIRGTWEPYETPVVRQVPSAAGPPQEMRASGRVHFRAAGQEMTLEPVVEEGDATQLFFIFGDASNGGETYGAGRFLYADPPEDGTVVLDFNMAYNPPCVFTPYATCPLPRAENILPVAVPAGEKVWGEH